MKAYMFEYSRIIYQRMPLFLKCFPLCFMVVLAVAMGNSNAGDLSEIFPVNPISGGFKPVGGPQEAYGKELFKLINGGAVVFLHHNFKRALFQEYVAPGGKSINLEIYQMGSAQDAKGIYTEKKGKDGAILGLGREGLIFDYYCILYQGSYFISITGVDATDGIRSALTLIAQQVVDNIKIMP